MLKLATSWTALHSAYFYFWIWWESKNVRQKKIVDSLQSILSVWVSCSYENRMQRLQTSFATRITTMKIKILFIRFQRRFLPFGQTLCVYLHVMFLLFFLYRRLFCWFYSLLSVFLSFSSCWLSLTLSLNFPHFQTRALYQCLAFYYSILFHIYLLYQKFSISYFSRLSSFARPSRSLPAPPLSLYFLILSLETLPFMLYWKTDFKICEFDNNVLPSKTENNSIRNATKWTKKRENHEKEKDMLYQDIDDINSNKSWPEI